MSAGNTPDACITSYAHAPAKTVTVGGDTFAYWEKFAPVAARFLRN
jgi:hypothetical protein